MTQPSARQLPGGHPPRGAVAMLAAALLGLASVLGCNRPLLAPGDERSPFDRYDGVRNQYATQTIPDEYGRERPNLRERLAPKD